MGRSAEEKGSFMYSGIQIIHVRAIDKVMGNDMERNMEQELEAGFISGFRV